ncbi:hypothetical protein BGC_43020 [Burkholderia sp. 3C]
MPGVTAFTVDTGGLVASGVASNGSAPLTTSAGSYTVRATTRLPAANALLGVEVTGGGVDVVDEEAGDDESEPPHAASAHAAAMIVRPSTARLLE